MSLSSLLSALLCRRQWLLLLLQWNLRRSQRDSCLTVLRHHRRDRLLSCCLLGRPLLLLLRLQSFSRRCHEMQFCLLQLDSLHCCRFSLSLSESQKESARARVPVGARSGRRIRGTHCQRCALLAQSLLQLLKALQVLLHQF